MKYLRKPKPLKLFGGSIEYSIEECVAYVIDSDESFQRQASRIRAGQRILTAFEPELVELKDEDYDAVHAAFENPVNGFGRWVNTQTDAVTGKVVGQTEVKVPARMFLPFVDAIDEAVNDPKKLPKVPEETPPAEPEPEAPPAD